MLRIVSLEKNTENGGTCNNNMYLRPEKVRPVAPARVLRGLFQRVCVPELFDVYRLSPQEGRLSWAVRQAALSSLQ